MAAIALYSLKGGVGKTTLAVNLAWAAATLSARRTLLWDLDPQGGATFVLGAAPGARRQARAIFTRDVTPAKLALQTGIARLDLIPADISLRELDLTLHELDKKKRLARLLEDNFAAYDRVVLDCPPGLTETSQQVMRAADLIIVPVIPSPLSTRAFEEIAAYLGAKSSATLMPVHAMVDRRRKLHAEALAAHPDWPAIPMASVVEAMAVRRLPLGVYAPRSPAARAFAELWTAIERRLAVRR